MISMTVTELQCPECAKVYTKEGWLESHIRDKHPQYAKLAGYEAKEPKAQKPTNNSPHVQRTIESLPHVEALRSAAEIALSQPERIIDCEVYYTKNIGGKICHVQFNILLQETEDEKNA